MSEIKLIHGLSQRSHSPKSGRLHGVDSCPTQGQNDGQLSRKLNIPPPVRASEADIHMLKNERPIKTTNGPELTIGCLISIGFSVYVNH